MATKKPAYRSEIAGAVHEMVAGFASVGVVTLPLPDVSLG
jgi:hypothetical protein